MPFLAHAPEALLPRSDSKNPATTCKGLTSAGRPCRRSLAASPRASPTTSPNGKGVIAVLPDVNDHHDSAAAYFCWQHKDQATALGRQQRTNLHTLEERSSIDSLANRLGVLEVDDGQRKKKKRNSSGHGQPVRRDTLPQQWQNIPGPLLAVPEDPFGSKPVAQKPKPHQKRTKGDVHFSFFCCMKPSEVDDVPASKPRPAMTHATPTSPQPSSQPPVQLSPYQGSTSSAQRLSQGRPIPNISPSPQSSSSQTHTLFSLIPQTVTPGTASLLLSELSKPFSPSDREPGYIYIFCLAPTTNKSRAMNPVPTGTGLQSNSNLAVPQRTLTGRRTSDAINTFARDSDAGSSYSGATRSINNKNRHRGNIPNPAKTLMLKIGRAANVQRRMNQWSNQCGHEIDLLRYYPYHTPSNPSTPNSSPHAHRRRSSSSTGPRQVPLVARVERLIHVELAERRIKRSCEGCGKEHREWFEIDASKYGVKGVDDVVRRWVAWGEREGANL